MLLIICKNVSSKFLGRCFIIWKWISPGPVAAPCDFSNASTSSRILNKSSYFSSFRHLKFGFTFFFFFQNNFTNRIIQNVSPRISIKSFLHVAFVSLVFKCVKLKDFDLTDIFLFTSQTILKGVLWFEVLKLMTFIIFVLGLLLFDEL